MRVPVHVRLAGTYVVVSALTLGIGGALIERRVANEVREELAVRVRHQAHLLAADLSAHPAAPSDADAWADRKGQLIAARVTLIAPDGRVLGDSSLTPEEVRAVENHGTRPEV